MLPAIARALNDNGHWAVISDPDWRSLYATDAWRLTLGELQQLVPFEVGAHPFTTEGLTARVERVGTTSLEIERTLFEAIGPYMLAATEGGRDELRELVDPRLRDIVDRLSPIELVNAVSLVAPGVSAGMPVQTGATLIPVRGGDERLLGVVTLIKPAASMAVLATMAAAGDPRHFERMQQVAKAGRRPAAILFADLESSASLARRLSTANYFTLGRRLTRAADRCVIDAGGLVGRHVGDGVVAFFLAESAGSESAAARSCVEAAGEIKGAMAEVAARSDLAPTDHTMRFGLHWGATLYVGQIATGGRTEVTALGDEVNEAARIEACATGGRTLASKHLLERLDPADAAGLGVDPHRLTYMPLAELPSASEKARRDAPAIAVCEI